MMDKKPGFARLFIHQSILDLITESRVRRPRLSLKEEKKRSRPLMICYQGSNFNA
jgi:hypothetical protein